MRLVNHLQWLMVVFLSWAPLFLIIYAVLVHLGFFLRSPITPGDSLVPVYIIAVALVLGLLSKRAIRASRTIFTIYMALYQITILLFLYFVSGFLSLPVIVFTLLYIIGYMWLGRGAAIVSAIIFFGFGILGSFIYPNLAESLIQNLMTASVLVLLGSLITIAFNDVDKSQNEVRASRQSVIDQQNRMSTLINNLADPIVSTNINGQILVYNAAFINLIDTNINLEGKNIGDIIKLQDARANAVDINQLLEESSTVSVRDDLSTIIEGELVRLEITSSIIRSAYTGETETSNAESGYILIFRDVTKSKSLEEERDEFISVVSHELRTPITVAEGTLSNTELMMQRGDVAREKLAENVALAHEQIVFLARMVNDLSTLSRAERGLSGETEDIDVKEMIHDLYNEYQPEAEDKKLQFDLNMPGKIGHVLTSRLYLKELLQNFVTNAIKYTREGSVSINVEQSKSEVMIAVKDSGIGISNSDQKRIFERFYRAEDYRTRETNGTGLGLYVAKKLADKIGTKIMLESRLNYGSTFSISLPLYTPSTVTTPDQLDSGGVAE